jgi:hypothetical protein
LFVTLVTEVSLISREPNLRFERISISRVSTFELVVTRQNRVNPLEKRCEDLKLLRCLIRPSLRHEKHRSFLFSRLDLLNRTDPGEEVRNVEYIL